jgi:hypothetical protein
MTATLKRYSVCVMADASIQANINVLAENPEQAGEEALAMANSGDIEFQVSSNGSYYLPDGVATAVSETEADEIEITNDKWFFVYLQACTAISVDGATPSTSFSTSTPNGEPEDQVLHVSWWDNGVMKATSFTVEGIRNGRINSGRYYCEDYEGQPTVIQFYGLKPLKMA